MVAHVAAGTEARAGDILAHQQQLQEEMYKYVGGDLGQVHRDLEVRTTAARESQALAQAAVQQTLRLEAARQEEWARRQ
jgi:membrane carboxypeptidase/penicillin-binding protein